MTFTVVATGVQQRYHWEREDEYQWRPLSSDMGRIHGVETATLTIDKVQKSDEGKYRCIASNNNGSEISQPTILRLGEKYTLFTYYIPFIMHRG